jgi:hypothetical protein
MSGQGYRIMMRHPDGRVMAAEARELADGLGKVQVVSTVTRPPVGTLAEAISHIQVLEAGALAAGFMTIEVERMRS